MAIFNKKKLYSDKVSFLWRGLERLVLGSDGSEFKAPIGLTVATTAGAGTAQSGSPVLPASVNLVTTAGGQTAVQLPVPSFVGQVIMVRVTSSTTGLLFPHVGGNIDGGSDNASVSIAQAKARILVATSLVRWDSYSIVA